MQASGSMNLSEEDWVRSLSCQVGTFSKAGTTKLLTILASPQILSQSSGLRLWGIVELPTCFSFSKGSKTSPISVLCSSLTSVANLSKVEAIVASTHTSSACRSLWMICVDTSAAVMPSLFITRSWILIAFAPRPACVPTAPLILPTISLCLHPFRRWMCLDTSLIHTDSFSPRVNGRACWPWVLPITIVLL